MVVVVAVEVVEVAGRETRRAAAKVGPRAARVRT